MQPELLLLLRGGVADVAIPQLEEQLHITSDSLRPLGTSPCRLIQWPTLLTQVWPQLQPDCSFSPVNFVPKFLASTLARVKFLLRPVFVVNILTLTDALLTTILIIVIASTRRQSHCYRFNSAKKINQKVSQNCVNFKKS